MGIKFYKSQEFPLEMHKVRTIQKLNLLPIDKRLEAIKKAGNNTFLLDSNEVFLDMLTDSGVNAMSDKQVAAMMMADDSYAGSESYKRLETKVKEFFHMDYFLPAHQGRACEHILSKVFIKPGNIVINNYHFTTAKAHMEINGGQVLELFTKEAVEPKSDNPFKGDLDIEKLKAIIKTDKDNIAFVRMELGTNLIGGQPVSLKNLQEVAKICRENNLLVVFDASLLTDNLYFIKEREKEFQHLSIKEINKLVFACADLVYCSFRKLSSARGGGIVTNNKDIYIKVRELIPLYEGFLTYGGMSVREIEAITVGLDEALDYEMINQGPQFIAEMCRLFQENNVPVITPPGGLGCHLDARAFLSHLKPDEYQAGALCSAIYLASGIRGMERGTISESRKEDGSETFANIELVRLALPRRVFTLSQIRYAVDRISWLYDNRHLIGGLKFSEEPKVLRFFLGKLEENSPWQEKLVNKFKADFKDSL